LALGALPVGLVPEEALGTVVVDPGLTVATALTLQHTHIHINWLVVLYFGHIIGIRLPTHTFLWKEASL